MKKEYANYPWVFWLSISYRPRWFKRFWKTRGSNYIEYQFWVFRVSVGRPWLKAALEAKQRDYGSAKYVHETNKANLKQPFSFLVKVRP